MPDYENPEIVNQKKQFDEWLLENFENKSTSLVVNAAELCIIREVLQDKRVLHTAMERFSFRSKNYSLNREDKVVRNVKGRTLKIVAMEDFFETIYRVHANDRFHQGNKFVIFSKIFKIYN